jgi:hypothetical protein
MRRSSFQGLKSASVEDPVTPPLDLTKFEPASTPRVDRSAALAARKLAEEAGHTLHPGPSPAAAIPKPRKTRVRITDVTGAKPQRPDELRTQLNITLPQSVALRFKRLEAAAGVKAWELLEQMMDRFEPK